MGRHNFCNTNHSLFTIYSVFFCRIESLEPLSDETEEEMMLREALEEEAAKVKDRIVLKSLPFDYCRLGAIQRKVCLLRPPLTSRI